MSDGNTHNNFNVPVVILGAKDQRIGTNRHVRYPKGTPLANLALSLMFKFGVPAEHFDNSTGKLNLLDI